MDIGFFEIRSFVIVLLTLCGAVAAVGGAITLLAKLYRWARKPVIENTEALQKHEQHLANDNHRIERLEDQVEEASKQNKLILSALVELLQHEIDGNHVDKLKDRAADIQSYLMEVKFT